MKPAFWRVVEKMTPEERAVLFETTITGIAQHNQAYKKARQSFYISREWREFRQHVLETKNKCDRCKRAPPLVSCLQLSHGHEIGQTIDSTVIKQGFLSRLKEENFGVLCMECHFLDHPAVIIGEWQIFQGYSKKTIMEKIKGMNWASEKDKKTALKVARTKCIFFDEMV